MALLQNCRSCKSKTVGNENIGNAEHTAWGWAPFEAITSGTENVWEQRGNHSRVSNPWTEPKEIQNKLSGFSRCSSQQRGQFCAVICIRSCLSPRSVAPVVSPEISLLSQCKSSSRQQEGQWQSSPGPKRFRAASTRAPRRRQNLW